jgi:hypothetical protein
MARTWCKVSASLDSHPRIRRAGNLGRQVFEFALRRNAEIDRNGVIPSEHLEAEYLADVLMMTPEQAAEGISRCVRTGLLALDSGHYVICGWDDEWGRRPMTEAERKRNQRAKVRERKVVTICPDTSVTDRDGPECHGSEESREEEKRSENSLPRAHAIPPSTEAQPGVDPGAGVQHMPAPSIEPAAEPVACPVVAAPLERQEQRVLWRELEQARAESAAKLGVAAQPLVFGDAGERDLAGMLAAARQRGPAELEKFIAQARHAIAMAKLETVNGDKPLEWFTGAVFSPNNFRRLVGKTTDAAKHVRAGPLEARGRYRERPPEQPRKTQIL